MATRKPTGNTIGNGGGLNCTLSYQDAGRKVRAYRVRASGLAHGLVQIASESHARDTRAYYPHRRSQAQFSITLDLMGRRRNHDLCERERFNAWLKKYLDYVVDQDVDVHPAMVVSIPVRNFRREGVLLGPIEYGEHVGSMLWRQTITFETTREPMDTKFALSSFQANGTDKDANAKFFYPASKQLSGSQRPDVYDTPIATAYDLQNDTPDWDAVNAAAQAPSVPPPSAAQEFATLPSGKRIPI